MPTEHPTTFVIFGATGDLARKKLFPALFHLFNKGYLPDSFSVAGVARREMSQNEFKDYVEGVLKEANISDAKEFLNRFQYIRGDFDVDATYADLAQALGDIDKAAATCSNKLFYLSVPPDLFNLILRKLSTSGLTIPCSDSEGWTRVLVEKPFGRDSATAEELDMLLGNLFEEKQIFRIDHYLAKQTVQNILAFRFSNSIFEPLWNSDHIESVTIEMFEKNTAENRGAFYDGIGALRDVGQNHLLQLLALIAMEPCAAMDVSEIRALRAAVFNELKQGACRARAQYEGYRETGGVADASETETFFALDVFVDNERWEDVPFRLVSGKALDANKVEIRIIFKDGTPACFMPESEQGQDKNVLTFSVQPEEGISLLFWARKPGFESVVEPRKLSFSYHDNHGETHHIDAYEKVIYDCIVGDQTLFASTDEVKASWAFITPVLEQLQKMSLQQYSVGATPESIMNTKK